QARCCPYRASFSITVTRRRTAAPRSPPSAGITARSGTRRRRRRACMAATTSGGRSTRKPHTRRSRSSRRSSPSAPPRRGSPTSSSRSPLPRTPHMNLPLRARTQLALFAGVYLLYLIGRWVTGGDMDAALEHARWVIDFEGGVGAERAVQDALDSPVAIWLL